MAILFHGISLLDGEWQEIRASPVLRWRKMPRLLLNLYRKPNKTIAEWQELLSESYKDGITVSGTKTPVSTNSKQTEPANSLPDYWKQKSEDFKYWKESYKYDYDTTIRSFRSAGTA